LSYRHWEALKGSLRQKDIVEDRQRCAVQSGTDQSASELSRRESSSELSLGDHMTRVLSPISEYDDCNFGSGISSMVPRRIRRPVWHENEHPESQKEPTETPTAQSASGTDETHVHSHSHPHCKRAGSPAIGIVEPAKRDEWPPPTKSAPAAPPA
jgi:hypothetical protein